ncbi:hypothetical protein PFUGPA_01077 [Plasmodium falciparum Palo Alto/Uganda]|uniref:Uncharacterized protein n=1 Tax=Plasmodium falciparum (isolate Palo Alto / Uganda) TaxID=57270 RepID=W4J5G6_PLAFP|nr:hypothetical protein PFUGPA_01077 [Plasmodium falciparum Palo Alto/Uganda]
MLIHILKTSIIRNINYTMSLCGMFEKSSKYYSCNNKTFVVTSTIVVILEYILGYSFDKYHESYHYIYVVYTHKIYCSTHWYIIYNTKKE